MTPYHKLFGLFQAGVLTSLSLSILSGAAPARTQTASAVETADLNSLGDLGDNEVWGPVALDGNHLAVRMRIGAFSIRILSSYNGVWGVEADIPGPFNPSIPQSAFGSNLSLAGDTLAVSNSTANSAGPDSGEVRIYVRDALGDWNHQQTLVASDASQGAGFGAPSIEGDRILVGAGFDSTQAPQAGAAYLFERAAGVWTETVKIQTNPPVTFDRLGRGVALKGDLALLSSRSGVTVFREVAGVWSEEAKLTHAAPLSATVSTDGTTIGVIESLDPRAILFEQVLGTWTFVGQIERSGNMPSSIQGSKIVIENGRAFLGVGFPVQSTSQPAISTWVAERTPSGWPSVALPVSTRRADSIPGSPASEGVAHIAASGDRIASVLLERIDSFQDVTGTVFIHEFTPSPPAEFCFGSGAVMGCATCPCGNESPPHEFAGCNSHAATSPRLYAGGLPRISKDTLRFELRYSQPDSFALLVSGDQRLPAAGPCPPGSGILGMPALDGLRCVGMNLVRHGTRSLDGTGYTPTPWGDADPQTSPGLIIQGGTAIGQTRHWQGLFRQPPGIICTAGIGTSQGISVTFAP